ncbi:MAG: hypothetical protein ACM3QU_06290 [Verrucomicrobiota bacterium]
MTLPHAFHLLAKPTGAVCNLDCEYCFFLSKEMLYPGSRFRMADDLLDEYTMGGRHRPFPEWAGGDRTCDRAGGSLSQGHRRTE